MRTLKVGDLVIHCRDGLAKITGETTINDRAFFLVHIVRESNETIYVPVVGAENIVRPVMEKQEADELIDYMNTISLEYNKNTKQRRDLFKKKLASGDVKEIAYLYRQLYFYEKIGGENNTEIKLGPVDIDMLSYAENMLMDELSLTYSVNRDEIKGFVEKRISKL